MSKESLASLLLEWTVERAVLASSGISREASHACALVGGTNGRKPLKWMDSQRGGAVCAFGLNALKLVVEKGQLVHYARQSIPAVLGLLLFIKYSRQLVDETLIKIKLSIN
ncbi:MAG: hypothetical protein ACRCW3_03940 [Metamycoplasmataceae bacterium]